MAGTRSRNAKTQACPSLRHGVCVFCALLLAACAFPIATDSVEFTPAQASRVFSTAYDHIVERYIEPVAVNELVVDGLKGLSRIDPEMSVTSDAESVKLSLGGSFLGVFPTPPADDADAWADLTVEVIESGRHDSPSLQKAEAEAFYEAVFKSSLSELDSFSRYASAEVARRNRASREGFGGIGVQILIEADAVRVVSVLPNTPAEKGDIQANDRITHIEDESVVGLGLHDIVDRLRGKIGTQVTVTISREEVEKPIRTTLIRRLIVGLTVSSKRIGDFAYIRITSFNKRTAKSLGEALAEIRPDIEDGSVKGLILDLRSNPGGLLDQAVEVADMFLSKGRIVSTIGRHPDSNQKFEAKNEDLALGLPIAVLINGNSASASEIVAAALQDQGRAVLVGSNSYGKGTVQNVITLPNDGELTLTWSRFHAPSGYTLHRLGVLPTVCTSAEKAGDETGDAGAPSAISLEDLQVRILESKAVLTQWRAARLPDDPSIGELRAVCPSNKKIAKRDIEVAKRLLSENRLYQRALSLSFEAIANM